MDQNGPRRLTISRAMANIDWSSLVLEADAVTENRGLDGFMATQRLH